jgi:8-oxo-dGTP diphosphatase
MAATAAEKPPVVPIVSAALVDRDGRVLLQQRPKGKAMAGLWEFPGGKIAAGESPEAALCRELKEELSIGVREAGLEPFGFASHRYDSFHILLLLYLCRQWEGSPVAQEGQALAWVAPSAMSAYPMPAADKPLVALLKRLISV